MTVKIFTTSEMLEQPSPETPPELQAVKADVILARRYYLLARQADELGDHAGAQKLRGKADAIFDRIEAQL